MGNIVLVWVQHKACPVSTMSNSKRSAVWAPGPLLVGKTPLQVLDIWIFTDLSRVYHFYGVRASALSLAAISQMLMSSGRLFGVTLGQSLCYAHWFPADPWHTKAFVCAFVVVFTLHLMPCCVKGAYGDVGSVSVAFSYNHPRDFFSIGDTIHAIGSTQYIWGVFVACHRNYSWPCDHRLSW